MKLQPKLLCALSWAIWGTIQLPAHAQQEATRTQTDLGTIVVTAAGYAQDIKDAPASISIINGDELRRRPVTNLEDAVRHLEGVSVVAADGATEEISIRGMPGEYTLILIDGKRQGTRETMSRGTGGVMTNFIPPAAAIERIEVIRGPMSSLYGSDAMGGVINIITRKIPNKWSGSLTLGGIFQEDNKMGNTRQGSFWLSGPIKEETLALQLYGNLQNRSEDDKYFTGQGATASPSQKDESLHAKLTITPNKHHDITLDIGRDVLTYDTTRGRSALPTAAANTVSKTKHTHDTISLNHTGRFDFGSTSVTAYYEEGTKDETLYNGQAGDATPKIKNAMLDGVVTLPFQSNVLKVGGHYKKEQITGIAKQDRIPNGYAANVDSISVASWALFAEDEYFVTDAFKLTGGVRYDKHDNFGSHFTSRLYANYDITPAWSIRGGIAQGFKAPTIRQSTAGYCITSGRANSGLRPGTLCGNPNLKAEKSTTGEIGIRFAPSEGTYFSATLFNNDFKNKVTSYDTGKPDPKVNGSNIYAYDNIDKVNLRGLELAGAYKFNSQFDVSGNYTYTKSKRQGNNGEPAYNGASLEGAPLDKTPEHAASLTANYRVNDQFSTWVTGQYTGKMYWAAFRNGANTTRTRGAATTFDLGASYVVGKGFTLKAAVMNLTDKVVPVDTRSRATGLDGNWMVDEGRRFWISGTYEF